MGRLLAWIVALSATVALVGCDDKPRIEPEYTGAPQAVVSKRVDEPVMGTRTKYKTETYCTKRKANGTCKTYGTRKVANGTEVYETDDRDWVLVLADGTEVDVDQAEYDRYQIGGMYP